MRRSSSDHLRFSPIVALAITILSANLFFGSGCASGHRQQAVAPSAGSAVLTTAPPQKLTGAELYAINCNRCHPERSPIERRSTEWKTILTHMRVRANLPATQARAILQYLQDNSGS